MAKRHQFSLWLTAKKLLTAIMDTLPFPIFHNQMYVEQGSFTMFLPLVMTEGSNLRMLSHWDSVGVEDYTLSELDAYLLEEMDFIVVP